MNLLKFTYSRIIVVLDSGLYFRGYARFVNVRDCRGATPLHLAARQRQPECIHVLLDNGALVSASAGGYG